MPLLSEWSPDEHSLAAVWEVKEDEDFFLQRLSEDEVPRLSAMKLPKRRLEHLAGRFLLKHLKEDFPLAHIAPDIHDKPRVPDDQYHFSISHSFPYIACLISDQNNCGIDIQTPHPRMEVLADKFLSGAEKELLKQDTSLFTLAWTSKEAVYKWNGRRRVDFRENIKIVEIENVHEKYNLRVNFSSLIAITPLLVRVIMSENFTVSFIVK